MVRSPAPLDTLAALQTEEEEIAALTVTSAQLYKQISAIADDRITGQLKRKMGRVNDILIGLMREKERELDRLREEKSKMSEQEHRAQAEKMYEDALNSYRARDYEKARIQFAEHS